VVAIETPTAADDEGVRAMLYHAARPALWRMMVIDKALRANKLPNARTLAKELEVHPRTVRRDLDYLRHQLGAPIEFDAVRNGYLYTEPAYKLPFIQVTEGELVALFLAERMLHQFRGSPFESQLRRAIDKLSVMLPDSVSVRLDVIADHVPVLPMVETQYNPSSFHSLITAAAGRRRLKMRYWSASRNETTTRLFDPYEVALVADGWYAVGHCHLRADIRMFAVQRVESVSETGETFDRPADFRVDDYLKASFGAVRGDGDYDVLLRFKPEVARRFEERKWHAVQAIERQADGSVLTRLHLSSLVEVKRWVMWWGADCEVLEPKELRELITRELREMLGLRGPTRRIQPQSDKRPKRGRTDASTESVRRSRMRGG
jgi:predicted DNA-binding transcriptional regulator YafY